MTKGETERIQILEDVEAIKKLKASYCYWADAGIGGDIAVGGDPGLDVVGGDLRVGILGGAGLDVDHAEGGDELFDGDLVDRVAIGGEMHR